jgi:nicotinamide-nucleotide amidase
VQTTILAAPGQIELHLSAHGPDRPAVDRTLDEAVQALGAALGDIVFSTDGRALAEVVGDSLRDCGARLAVAESCTGGLVLGRLTDVPGSSAWIVGGVMAYANSVKIDQLGVPSDFLRDHGAVSEPVAVAMAEGVRDRLKADIGLSVTGIAGPSGGTLDKPVGTVAIAVSRPPRPAAVRTFRFVGDRVMVRLQAIQAALDMVRRSLRDP